MNFCSRVILITVLLVMTQFVGHAQGDVCSVFYYWVDRDSGFSTSDWNLVDFHASPDEKEITHMYLEKESGKSVRVGVWYIDVNSTSMPRIRLAIAFTGKPENIFSESNDRSEAETVYDKNWRWMSVSKKILVDNREYTFELSCHKGNKKRS